MEKTITFQFGAEKMIKISQVGHRDSLFYEGYRQALAGVAEIIRASRMYTSGGAHRRDVFFSQECDEKLLRDSCPAGDRTYYNYPNNMLAFTGSRGSGKSSAMLTFVDSLQNPNSAMFEKNFLDDMANCELASTEQHDFTALFRECTFVALPPVDPTLLEKDGNILTVILSHMFRKASEIWEDESNGRCSSGARGIGDWNGTSSAQLITDRNKLIQQFNTCYEHISAIKGGQRQHMEYENLEMLAKLGDSSKLKQELAALVQKLLEFCVGDVHRDAYLVLQIDDTDMNIKRAYEILEDIRKYLVIPRLIIIMATNLEHLTQVVESTFRKDYNEGLPNLPESIHHIAHQYIIKLFPQTRQINLPQLDTYLRERVENTKIQFEAAQKLLLPDDSSQFTDSQEQIFRLIYRKTGIVFRKHTNNLHYIIPDNMRLLSHFFSMLTKMRDVASPDDPHPGFFHQAEDSIEEHMGMLQTRLENVQRFRDYFLSAWVGNALSADDAHNMHILANANLSEKVAYVCTMFGNDRAGGKQTDGTAEQKNYEYVDMIELLKQEEDNAAAKQDKKLLFAIRTYFSLLGHCIALEDLITCYHTNGASAPMDCVFPRLHALFGSKLFTYAEDKKGRVIANSRVLGEDTAEKNGRAVIISWKKKKNDLRTPSNASALAKGQLGLFCAMLLRYDSPRNDIDVQADLCSAITNALYISPTSATTPFLLKNFPRDVTVMMPRDDKWRKMRNSSLLVVLNWEVQQAIGRWIAQRVDECKVTPPTEEWEVLYGILRNFYTDLALPFRGQASLDPDTRGCAIYCLEKIDLSAWLSGVSLANTLLPSGGSETENLQEVVSVFFPQAKK